MMATRRGWHPSQRIQFHRIQNPVILAGTESHGYRDPAVIYNDGTFFLHFSVPHIHADG